MSARATIVRARLWNRDFLLLWQGQLTSQVGSQAAFVAMMLWTLEATGSPGTLSLLLVMSSIPAVLLGPVAGTVADRHSRRLLMVGADVVRGVAALGVGWCLRAGLQPRMIVPVMLTAALVNGVAGAVFGPAVRAALPDLVPRERLGAANGLSSMGGQISALAGLAAGGTVYAWAGPALLFLADGVSYLISAFSEWFIRLPGAGAKAGARPLAVVIAEYRSDIAAGLRYCLNDAGRRGFILLAAGLNFLFMPVFVLLPLYVERVLAAGSAWYGYLLAGMSAGSLLGLLLAGTVGDRDRLRGTLLVSALVMTGMMMAVLGRAANAPTALVLLVAIGAATGVVNVLVITLMQVRTPPELRGRALAVLIALTSVASPVGLAVGGIVGELAGSQVRLVFTLAGVCAFALTLAVVSSRAVRSFLSAGPAGEERTALQ